jgi:LmbE family N-acetylglucosaminyl deacetylase
MSDRRTLPTAPTIAALVVVALALSAAASLAMRPRAVAGAEPMQLSDFGRRVLVIATHPDDETLTAGGAISDLVARGAQVRVVIVTAGDAYPSAASQLGHVHGRVTTAEYRHLGEVRHHESMAAAARLGLAEADVISLGFPDGGTAAMWNADWDREQPYTGRSGASDVPYPWAAQPGADDCGEDLATALETIIRDFKPDSVISPDTRETNTDHAAVAAFTLYALDEADFSGTHFTSIVHFRGFPAPRSYLPHDGLAPPPQLLGDGAEWFALPLRGPTEMTKLAAIDDYRSQTSVLDTGIVMRSLVRTNELYCVRPASSPSTTASDERPDAGSAGTIAMTPPPVTRPFRADPARIDALRMVRGPNTLWLGLVCDGPVPTAADFLVDLRLIGGLVPSQRLQVLVHRDRAEVLRSSEYSVVPGGVTASIAGDTLWVSVPVSVLDGRTHVIAGSLSQLAGFGPAHTPWVDVRL